MSHSYYTMEELLIKTFLGRNVIYTICNRYFATDSIQRNIICLEWLAVSITEYKPPPIIFFEELGMKSQFEWFLSESMIGETKHLSIGNSFVETRQKMNVGQVLIKAGTDLGRSLL